MIEYISKLPGENFVNSSPRTVVILGSTGSIGCSALDVIASNQDAFKILALAGGKNIHLLAEQANKWRPAYLAVQDDLTRQKLISLLQYQPEVLSGQSGYIQLAALPNADLVLSAQVGAAGLCGTLSAVKAGKVVALANKESLVLAGNLIRNECAKTSASILPVDSEHNAIFQCLGLNKYNTNEKHSENTNSVFYSASGNPKIKMRKLILTASGGPFRGKSSSFIKQAGKEDALAHPTWSMGAKITIDSATLMNKGLEVVEACHLFGLPPSSVSVVVHPQSIIHSMIEFDDNSVLAQMGPPDMRVPISFCLGWPKRLNNSAAPLNLLEIPSLSFEQPNTDLFPCLNLCRQAFIEGRGLTVALNAANEIAVSLFMDDKIKFCGISKLVAAVLEQWDYAVEPKELEEILELDEKARNLAKKLAGNKNICL